MAFRLTRARISQGLFLIAGLGFAAALVGAQVAPQGPAGIYQGSKWTPERRDAFYSTDQGSELIPLAWARALPSPDGSGFLDDQLARYGYLANPASPDRLPVGFTVDNDSDGVADLGMSCAACHTREIVADGQRYRIDGAPALSDFQGFLSDLYRAVSATLASPAAFGRFSAAVLGAGASPADVAALRAKLMLWDQTEGTFVRTVLPPTPWGVGRLDAVSMIFDRVTGLDIGSTPQAGKNLYPADAPVRYPFIWNAPLQDKTQWPGFAANGDNLLALTRNLGEVYGVFAHLDVRHPLAPNGFLQHNSAKFDNLVALEQMVTDIGAPKWPWLIDEARRARGADIYATQCASCHEVEKTTTRFIPRRKAWVTPLFDVGTDTRERDILTRSAPTGVLRREIVPPLGSNAHQFTILQTVVVQTLLNRLLQDPLSLQKLLPDDAPPTLAAFLPAAKAELKTAYDGNVLSEAIRKTPGTNKYEARRLYGIWAAAPYLHNGSVQSLAQLLTPEDQRRPAFVVGQAFDRDSVGLAEVQPGPPAMRVTTGCADIGSGNSHCGHTYGTMLGTDQKRDLIEFLKTL